MEAAKTILALAENLMYTVKIRDAASMLGATTIASISNYELGQKIEQSQPSLLVMDLTAIQPGWKDLVKNAKAHGVAVIGFAPHVNKSLHREALDAGCDEVFANSKFSLETYTIIQKYLQ